LAKADYHLGAFSRPSKLSSVEAVCQTARNDRIWHLDFAYRQQTRFANAVPIESKMRD
jgi:hypothetical protein